MTPAGSTPLTPVAVAALPQTLWLPLRLLLDEPGTEPVQPVAAATSATAPDYTRRLPGISYVKLVAYWQGSLPLTCRGPITANRQLVWTCDLVSSDGAAQLSMIIFATAGDSISRVSISVMENNPTGKETADRWLAYAAGTPVAGVPLDQVKQWLAGLATGNDSLTVAKVKYTVQTTGAARTLEITPATSAQ